ncbi:hypothetical protein BD311DRAFT_674828 [Dichomitus squalens]|uniref:CFEM domain-containing protein n=1 Tax=Dichomitus squalens TaxID=114155 RepID=A0A4Q9M7V8_9APHY|nr:hypothetical protein BD311DRAFT_674828 [Dichomitus squalens]
MKFNAVAFTVVAVVAGAHAQSSTAGSAAPTSTNGISPCILTCIEQAASANGCSSALDVSCLCSNTQFQQSALSCLESSCSSSDVQAAQALQSAECGAGDSATSAASSHASSAASSAASQTSNAAMSGMRGEWGVAKGGLLGVAAAMVGVVAGAAFVL